MASNIASLHTYVVRLIYNIMSVCIPVKKAFEYLGKIKSSIFAFSHAIPIFFAPIFKYRLALPFS